MDSALPNASGFPAHVMQQLQHASEHVQGGQVPQTSSRGGQRGGIPRGLNRGQSNNTRYSQSSHQTNTPNHSHAKWSHQHTGYQQGNVPQQAPQGPSARPNQIGYHQNMIAPRAGTEDDFPALGSSKSGKTSRSSSQASSQLPGLQSAWHERAHDFQQRARAGSSQGHNSFPHQNSQGRLRQQNYAQQPRHDMQQLQVDDFRRPTPRTQGVYSPITTNMTNQRHAFHKRVKLQSEYLETIADVALQNQMPVEEQQEKEAMRQNLEQIMHEVIRDYDRAQPTIDPAKVKLKCYGSLASGFAVAGSDMDLLVTFPRNGQPTETLEEDIKRLFEKALLDLGYGARLLTQTRVPIMRVCETPTPDILDGLRRYRAKWEQDEQDAVDILKGNFDSSRLPIVTREQIETVSHLFAELGDEPRETPLPPSPGRELPHLEYTKDCGIQCDINFSNYVALHNTRLLRTYCLLDERVRRMGLIVKAWAKARKINTPYHGTLSSYGYILMVLHFLMNVASPPLVPNLQAMATDKDAWAGRTDFETVDGFDVRFVSDPEQVVAEMEGLPRNQDTLGALLRGFFCYYSDHGGFHWTNDIISLRTVGGALTKRSKGWTEAKWTGARNTVRNRYLLCIEDPFETEHNVARTVCHSGIVAIRDEFRRARQIIERVEKVRGVGWQWFEDSGEIGQDFMAVAQDRGDLLRKDQDFHKLRKLRAEVEATEKALKEASALVDHEQADADNGGKQDGTSSQHYSHSSILFEAEDPSWKLTQVIGHQQDKSLPRQGRLRRVKYDSDDEDEGRNAEGNYDSSAMEHETLENNSLSTLVSTSLIVSEKEDESNPYCFDTEFCPRSVDGFGKLLAWDLNTQEGRWLHWRDGKVRDGTFTGIISSGLRTLNEQCPFDPARPLPVPRSHNGNLSLIRPPFPMSRPIDEEAMNEHMLQLTNTSESAAVSLDLEDDRIGWDLSVSDCRWLSKRDERIQAGTFNLPNDPLVRNLHLAFPYLPSPSRDEQLWRNDILRQRNTQWLKGEISQHFADDFVAYLEYLERERSQDSQAEINAWDLSLSDGRWLSKRDGMVRDGMFRRTRCPPEALQLHDDFPYIFNTSLTVQRKRNLQLRLRDIERQIAQIPEELRQAYEDEMHQTSSLIQISSAEISVPEPEESTIEELAVSRGDGSVSSISEVRTDTDRPQWELRSRLGRWLEQRDQAKLAGISTRGAYPWQRKLDKRFPFIATLSAEEQVERNEVLRTLDRNAEPVSTQPARNGHTTKRSSGVKLDSSGSRDDSAARLVSFSEDDQEAESDTTNQPWMKIMWERSTRNGRWLSWRDKQIKQGTWTGVADWQFRHLNDVFPYIENPTLEEQADRNTRLLVMCNDYNSGKLDSRKPKSAAKRDVRSDQVKEDFRANAGASTDGEAAYGNVSSNPGQGDFLPRIEWDSLLLIGTWLIWRDKKIRSGRWMDTAGKGFLRWLDDTFPYVAKPTLEQQAKMTEKLKQISEKHCKLNDYVGLRGNDRPTIYDMEQILSLSSAAKIPERGIIQRDSAEVENSSRDFSASHNTFIRNQRLNYFDTQSATRADERSENQNPNSVVSHMAKVDITTSSSTSIAHTVSSEIFSGEMRAAVTSNPGKTDSEVNSRALVLQSLHEGSIDDRPRDEDPKIMPVPSTLAFAFDERQLRDMDIIKQGGNGCARFGEEWNIETEEEWGGGGWMGCKSSSKQEQDEHQVENEKWDGNGDQDGLLGELPGL